jgi:hypothetical protein
MKHLTAVMFKDSLCSVPDLYLKKKTMFCPHLQVGKTDKFLFCWALGYTYAFERSKTQLKSIAMSTVSHCDQIALNLVLII